MNQILPERRDRKRKNVSAKIELIAGDTRIPAQLLDISFAGLRCRVDAGGLDGVVDQIEAVKLEGLPEIAIHPKWSGSETMAATFQASEKAGRILGGFHELYIKPEE